jgi:methionyl-tRNA synthetase
VWSGANSKTAGTAVNLDDAIEQYGDALAMYCGVGFHGGDCWDPFDARYTADLADTLGNLASRSLSMIHRYRNGTVPQAAEGAATAFDADVQRALVLYAEAMDGNHLLDGAAQVMAVAASANRYIEESAPWKLAKEGADAKLDQVLADLARTLVRLAILAHPFMPEKSGALWSAVCPGIELAQENLQEAVLGLEGRSVAKPPILFPKPRSDALSA